jgi:hypothetical protein
MSLEATKGLKSKNMTCPTLSLEHIQKDCQKTIPLTIIDFLESIKYRRLGLLLHRWAKLHNNKKFLYFWYLNTINGNFG